MVAGTVVQRQRSLVERLYKRTASGEMDWDERHVGVFATPIGSRYILISRRDGQFETDDYCISILNEELEVVDTFSDVDLGSAAPTSIDADLSYFKLMEDLYSLARRKAMGADEALNEILSELE